MKHPDKNQGPRYDFNIACAECNQIFSKSLIIFSYSNKMSKNCMCLFFKIAGAKATLAAVLTRPMNIEINRDLPIGSECIFRVNVDNFSSRIIVCPRHLSRNRQRMR